MHKICSTISVNDANGPDVEHSECVDYRWMNTTSQIENYDFFDMSPSIAAIKVSPRFLYKQTISMNGFTLECYDRLGGSFIQTVGKNEYGYVDGKFEDAVFGQLAGMALGASSLSISGNNNNNNNNNTDILYLVDSFSDGGKVRKVDFASSTVSTVVSGLSDSQAMALGIAADNVNDELYVSLASFQSMATSIIRITGASTSAPAWSVLFGNISVGGDVDGLVDGNSTDIRLSFVHDLDYLPRSTENGSSGGGVLYIADMSNNKVKVYDSLTKTVATLATFDSNVQHIHVTPNGKVLYVATGESASMEATNKIVAVPLSANGTAVLEDSAPSVVINGTSPMYLTTYMENAGNPNFSGYIDVYASFPLHPGMSETINALETYQIKLSERIAMADPRFNDEMDAPASCLIDTPETPNDECVTQSSGDFGPFLDMVTADGRNYDFESIVVRNSAGNDTVRNRFDRYEISIDDQDPPTAEGYAHGPEHYYYIPVNGTTGSSVRFTLPDADMMNIEFIGAIGTPSRDDDNSGNALNSDDGFP